MFRAGIIGAGLMGALHARTLVSLPGVEVVAIASRTLEEAQRLAEEVGAESYDDYRRVLEAPIDAVWLTTPDHLHREIAVATLEAGKHLFVEKTLAASLEDGRAILAAAERHSKLKAMVGYLLRFNPRYHLMHRVVNEENAGRPLVAWSLRTAFLNEREKLWDKYRREFFQAPAWYFDRATGKGPIYSHCSHDYDMLMWLCGPVRSVHAQGDSYLVEKGDIADGFFVTLRFASGGTAIASTPWVSRVQYDQVGVATEQLTVVNNHGQIRIKRGEEPEEHVEIAEEDSTWNNMEQHFISCVQEDKPPLISIADGLRVIAVSEAAFRSLYEGREVTIAEVEGAD
jgi:predicted dehydrogenase